MTATSIIKEQFKHIISNFKDYFLIALPLIIGHVIVLQGEGIFDTYSDNFAFLAIYILVGILYVYYIFRFAVNLHRLVILQEKNNYYSPLKHKKITLFYFLYLLIYFFVMLLVIVLVQIIDGLLNANYAIYAWLYLYIMIIVSFLYSIYGFILPEIAIGNKVSLKLSRHKSKGYRKILFYQFLILYVPFWIFDRIVKKVVPVSDSLSFNFIYAIIFAFLTSLFIGSLSRTYLIAKEQNSD